MGTLAPFTKLLPRIVTAVRLVALRFAGVKVPIPSGMRASRTTRKELRTRGLSCDTAGEGAAHKVLWTAVKKQPGSMDYLCRFIKV